MHAAKNKQLLDTDVADMLQPLSQTLTGSKGPGQYHTVEMKIPTLAVEASKEIYLPLITRPQGFPAKT